jgi:geranylgeranyl pyrophosphate synthase
MTTLFRSNLAVDNGGTENGFQLFVAVLDSTREPAHQSTTWIDRVVLDSAIKRLSEGEAHIDPGLQRAILDALKLHGPPRPIELRQTPEFRADPLNVCWGDYRLQQSKQGFQLQFVEPSTDERVQLLLDPGPELEVACSNETVQLGEGMAYRSFPRLTLTGNLSDGAPIAGEAWMDHQWGNTDWFRDSQAGVWLGWDWFGINLEDGSDWLVMLHRDAQTGRAVGRHASTRSATGDMKAAHDFTLTPLRYWDSPATHISYPVAWRIEIPLFDADFEFQPVVDDQEVASFGIMRSVWEGAGQIAGTVAGKSVCGRARGEFHGYGYVFDYKDFLMSMGRRIDRQLETFFPRQFSGPDVERFAGPPTWKHVLEPYTEILSRPIWDLIDRSGKHWRPLFGILMLEAMGTPSAPYEQLISSVAELIHAGALIVDDIEDDSKLRRSQECLHLRYGVNVALNAANALYFFPGAAVLQHPLLSAEKRGRLLEIKEQAAIDAHCGQTTDIYWSQNMRHEQLCQWLADDIESMILQMYVFKTATAPKALAQMAALLADADAALTSLSVDFAQSLGVAFQIVDDIHNFSQASDWTKVAGEDLATGKLTFVIVSAIRRLAARDSRRLQEILCSQALRNDPAALDEGIQLILKSGSLDYCRDLAKKMSEDAWAKFSAHVPSSDASIMLHAMCLKLLDLAYDG